jgi:hypothetical protein
LPGPDPSATLSATTDAARRPVDPSGGVVAVLDFVYLAVTALVFIAVAVWVGRTMKGHDHTAADRATESARAEGAAWSQRDQTSGGGWT